MRKIGALIGLLAMVCNLALVPLAEATRYWVATTGNDSNPCTAIDGETDPGVYKLTPMGGAVCLTEAGDRLTIKAGLYTGPNARFYEPTVSIVNGTVGNRTIIEGAGGVGCAFAGANRLGNCLTILRPNSAVGTNFENASYITLRGMEFDYTNMSDTFVDACIRLGGSGTGVVIEDMDLHHCHGDGILGSTSAHFIDVHRVNVHQAGTKDTNGLNPSHGMYAGGDDIRVEDSWFWDCGPLNGEHNNCGAIQIFTDSPAPNDRADRAFINRVEVWGNDFGVAIDGQDAVVQNTIIRDNTGAGIAFGYTNSARGKLLNTSITRNGTGVQWGLFGPAADGLIANNHIVENTTNLQTFAGATNLTQTANRMSGSLNDCNVSASDFHQRSGVNPCADAGTDLTSLGVTTDFFNVTRPQGGGFDIGAGELVVAIGDTGLQLRRSQGIQGMRLLRHGRSGW